ncbi:uncharacterized protein LOC144129296 [Amblyomma americanum]
MRRLCLLSALLATLAQPGSVDARHIGGPATGLATNAQQFKRVPHNVQADVGESREWKPNLYVRRGPRQGVLFMPKPSTTPLWSYFTTKIATGKRCADDFDCMRVLGQICKRGKRGSSGNCQCPESTPVHLADETQPRCVAARHIFEDCADTVECSFLNPHVECVNQVCTCRPPNILKHKEMCVPAGIAPRAAKAIAWIAGAILFIGIIGVIIVISRKLANRNDTHSPTGPTYHSQYWREDRPNVWDSTKVMLSEMQEKVRALALRRRGNTVAPAPETRVAAYLPSQSKPNARHVRITTVKADVHRSVSPDEDAGDPREGLLPTQDEAGDQNDRADLSPTSRDLMLGKEESNDRRKMSLSVSRHTGHVADSKSASRSEAGVSLKDESPEKLSGAPASVGHVFDPESDAERIMRMVLHQLVLERSSILQAHSSAKEAVVQPSSRMMGGEAKPTGTQGSSSDLIKRCQENFPADMLPISSAVRSIYSHTLVTLRNRILSNSGRDAESVDDVSYGDSCKPCEEKECIENSGELCRDGEMQRMDKGAGEEKSKIQADIPAWRQPFTGVKDSASSKEAMCSNFPLKAAQKPKAIHKEAMSEQKLLPPLVEASLLGSRPDAALESYKSYTCPVDAYPVMQNWTLPKRTYLFKDGNQCGASHSYHSFSDTSRSRHWKGSRKSAGAPSVFSQSAGRCGTETKMSALRAQERSGKTGDTFKSFMSSIIYPNSTAATSTRSAGCFQTVYSDVPQQRTRIEERKCGAADQLAARRAPRVHYYDADVEEHNQTSSFGLSVQPLVNAGQPQTVSAVTKKRSILKNAGTTTDDKKSGKDVQRCEEERPLLLKKEEPRSKDESSRNQSPCGGPTAEQRGISAQKEAVLSSQQTTHSKDGDVLVIRNPASTKEFPSFLVELKTKVPATRAASTTPSRTSSSTRRSSKHSRTKIQPHPGSVLSLKKRTKTPSIVPSKNSSDEQIRVNNRRESRAMNEGNVLESVQKSQPSAVLSDELIFPDKPARLATHFNKLKLPFGVKLGGGKQQWSKAVDGKINRMNEMTSHTLLPNEAVKTPMGSFTDRREAISTTEDPAKKGYARRQQPTPDDVINLNVTEDELIRCINRLVAINACQDQDNERKFPEAFAEQAPVSGCQLMRDTLLHSEAVSSEATDRKGQRRDTERCSSSQSDALNRPLYSLRRGDLKDILKEILEEEYSHLLHASAQVAREGTTDTKISDPVPRCTDHDTNATSQTSKATSLNTPPSVQGRARNASTAAGDAGIPKQSQSGAHCATTAEIKGGSSAESSQAEGDTTRTSSNTKSASASSTQTSQEAARSINRRPTSESSVASSSKLTDGQNKRVRLAEQHLEAVSEDTSLDGYCLEEKKLARDVSSKATSCRTRSTTSPSTAVDSTSIEQGHVHVIPSVDFQGERLLSDISVESASTSKPPEPGLSCADFVDLHLSQPRLPGNKIFPDEQWQKQVAFEPAKKSQVSWNPPAYITLPDIDATAFSYTEERMPLPDVQPPIDITLSASNASLAKSQQDLKPFPHSGLVNRSDSYVPFGNWSYHAPDANTDYVERQQHLNRVSYSASASQTTAKAAPEEPGKGGSVRPTLFRLSQRPKSASFHGFSGKNANRGGSTAAANHRTKSHTDYWLKTVSLYQELTTDQMSSSGETFTDASGTNTIFEPEQIEALEQAKLRDDARRKDLLQNDEISPLLQRFLMLQDMPLTSESTTAAERTPREVNNEGVGSGARFDTSLPEYSLLNRFLETCSVAADCIPKDQASVGGLSDYPKQQGASPSVTAIGESVQRRVTSSEREQQIIGLPSPETGSPNVDTVGNQASFEDSASTSFCGEKRVKAMRKTAPYRTPFPLCSSSRSTAAFRYKTRAIKKNWKHRMAAVSKPADETADFGPMQYFMADQAHATRSVMSEALVPPDHEENDVQRMSASALPNTEAGNFWSSRSFHVQQWLNQAAQFFTNYEEGMRTAEEPQAVVSEPAETSTSSEYYEAEPTTDTFAHSSQQGLTDDPNNWG